MLVRPPSKYYIAMPDSPVPSGQHLGGVWQAIPDPGRPLSLRQNFSQASVSRVIPEANGSSDD